MFSFPKEPIVIIKSIFFYEFLLIHLSIYLFYTPRPEEQLFIEGGWIELRHGVQDVHMYSQDAPCSMG